MTKRVIALLTALIIGISAAACGSSGGGSEDSSSSSTEASAADQQSASARRGLSLKEETEDYGSAQENANRTFLIAYFTRPANTDFSQVNAGDEIDTTSTASINVQSDGSYVGNAQMLAQYAASATGGELYQILVADKYSPDYDKVQSDALDEQEGGTYPYLSDYTCNVDGYDTIVLVIPIWWGTIPQAVKTFLSSYDFGGKTIIPIVSEDGSGMGLSVRDIEELCPDATVKNGISVKAGDTGSAESTVSEYLKKFMN